MHPRFFHDPSRRRVVLGALAAGASLAGATAVRAQGKYPSQPIRIVVPFGPGGLADISTRLTAQKLGEKLGTQVVIDNRPGAGGVVAAQYVLGAAHDGYTLILFSNGTTIATSLLKLPFDPQADFVPVSSLGYFDLNLLVAKDSPFADLKALLAESKKRQLTLGTINPGSTQHLSGELFKSVTQLNAAIVPFRTSGEVQMALQRGDVDVGFESYAALRGGIDAGVLRALATTGPARTPWLPKVPTVKEAGVAGYEVTGWNALFAPKGTPPAIAAALNAAMRSILAEAELRKRLLGLGVDPKASTQAEMAAVFERDRLKWAQVIKQANIKI
ncbi:tripartite tricarboxylate transporter substrate binding protein [Variovorax sp. 770b2]|uniref:Bug family tripartite tricarboxylate transporter substrate binding protein n=1 Tax=Variovorax sp. 770b2 TaxID=1566271 RepID=UPI0008E03B66|nr:tripartite tricarboxylate transporter substrate-binding protein [Variovorax sp. 770b2]SFP90913.1 Tripartite-type tricarboxylate transporter, receptor component TctC [Variovorax sp. 770b2]